MNNYLEMLGETERTGNMKVQSGQSLEDKQSLESTKCRVIGSTMSSTMSRGGPVMMHTR